MTHPSSTSLHSFPNILGYAFVEQLYLGSRTAVYRAVQTATQRPVVIKVLRREYPSFGELVQFRNQYAIAKNLPIPGIVQPLSIEPLGSGYALVMEDCGGVALGNYVQPLDLIEVLAIAIQIADILDGLCQHRVVHKDIKPANILIHPESKQVKLIDFSIASLLPKETQDIQSPNILEGTLAYLAPEQTGRMNRGIDYRADFYALGVTLYQLLTGTLPFAADDPLELMHCHIAKMPVPANQVNSDVPGMVAAIVTKLMAKNAEDRYQSAMGLKHDLEQCLTQWKELGAIAEFELGQRDVSDRFLIPEKLYGREAEVQSLLAAFDRVASGASELMLVAGFSGVGKTVVVNEVHKPIVRQRGYFIKGKFDQLNRNIPLSAFVQALRDLMGQLLSESDAQLLQWQAQILAAVGDNGQVLIDVIPELEQIIGKQPSAPELSGSAAQNRFNLLFQKFIEVFTTAEHPLVMFLDDLQWADSASLQLIKLLMNDNGYLLMLGAYRDNEVSPAHPFILTVEETKKARAIVNTITLAPLTFEDTNDLVADTLNCSAELAQPLTELIDRKTQGNPFFTTQFLKALHEDGYIRFNYDRRYWECDIAQVNTLVLTDDVVEFMTLQLQKLPTETQQVLRLAACVGNQFDLATLAIISEQSSTDAATALWNALREGFILPTSQVYKFFQSNDTEHSSQTVNPTYRFLHDRVQQAAYYLIPEQERAIAHYQIGKLLLQQLSPDARAERIFEVVNQLNRGAVLIQSDREQQDLAQLNLAAGQKARSATAYGAALDYFKMGIALLRNDRWQHQYNISLALYEGATEAAYLSTDFEQMEQLAETVLTHAHSWLDQVPTYKVKIQASTAQNQHQEALRLAREVLNQLGVHLPEQPTQVDVEQGLQHTLTCLSARSIESLLELPEMTALEPKAAMAIVSNIMSVAYQVAPKLLPLLTFVQIDLSMRYGNAAESTYGYVRYGLMRIAMLGGIDSGYRFGQLGMNLLQRMNASKLAAKTIFGFNLLRHWREPAKDSLNGFLQAYTCALETGDPEYASLSLMCYGYTAYYSGQELSALKQTMDEHRKVIHQFRQDGYFNIQSIYYQTVLNLLEPTAEPDRLCRKDYDEDEMIQHYLAANQLLALCQLYCNKLLLSYWFHRYEQALENARLTEQYLSTGAGLMHVQLFSFYDALLRLTIYPTVCETEQLSLLGRVTAHQEKLQEWSTHAPSNHSHRCALVAAERCRVLDDKAKAIALYDRAIAGAKENGYIQEEALANELAAQFYLNWDKEKIAQDYLTHAYYGYAHWGAKAKVQDLERRYPNLLAPILQQQRLSLSATETSVAPISFTAFQTGTLSCTSNSTSISAALDLATVLKASQTLSSEIQLDKLLATLLHTVLENAGADKGALLMPRQQQWFVEAIATVDQPARVESIALSSSLEIPHALINSVKRSRQPVAIVDVANHPTLATDPYVVQQQPKSLLCTPILQQGKLVAILYLENHVTLGAFTSDRVELLNFLCAQAAISLENARLYQQAQTYTQQLVQSQLQIVQSEKMASLGNLVAGVAHEINNPIGFLSGSINNAKDYVKDLLDHLELYQQHYPNAAASVQDHAEDIDLEFLREDLPKLLTSMKGATDRIKGISTSLRTFSRADTEYKVSANLHEGIDSTLLILKYRIKGNEHRSDIQIIQDYGNLPPIECFPGQLNQVFMNILANAIDVFDEAAQQSSLVDLQANPQKITIQTVLIEKNTVEIRICDNGRGMSEAVKDKIFDHLFTTKGVGKGTGLGLAIARQIVVEKHGGSIEVQSKLGQGVEFCIRLPIRVE
jgi:predicted ATPase/signal transduction histidine kinase